MSYAMPGLNQETFMSDIDNRELAREYLSHDQFVTFCRYMHAEAIEERQKNNDLRGLEFYDYYVDNFEHLLNTYKKHLRREKL